MSMSVSVCFPLSRAAGQFTVDMSSSESILSVDAQ